MSSHELQRDRLPVRKDDRALVASIIRRMTAATNIEQQGKLKADAVMKGSFDKDATVQAVACFRIDAGRDLRLKLAKLADWLDTNLGTVDALTASNPRDIAERSAKVAADLRAYLSSLSTLPTEKEPEYG